MDTTFSSMMKKMSKYESEISSILGMIVVAALAVFIFLFVKRFMPKPNITPVAEQTTQPEDLMKKANPGTYTVKAGQGLSQIAAEVYKDSNRWTDIAKANDLKAPYTISKGQELKLPEVGAVVATAKPTATPTATPVTKATVAPTATPASTTKLEVVKPTTAPLAKLQTQNKESSSKADSYVVQKGDHLWKIAVAQYGDGHAWTKIYEANKKLIGKNPGIIYSGSTLVLPR